jgi:hypothetical protein
MGVQGAVQLTVLAAAAVGVIWLWSESRQRGVVGWHLWIGLALGAAVAGALSSFYLATYDVGWGQTFVPPLLVQAALAWAGLAISEKIRFPGMALAKSCRFSPSPARESRLGPREVVVGATVAVFFGLAVGGITSSGLILHHRSCSGRPPNPGVL